MSLARVRTQIQKTKDDTRAYMGWCGAVVCEALVGTMTSLRKHALVEGGLVVAVAVEAWWSMDFSVDAFVPALGSGLRVLVILVALTLLWNVLAAPYRWHREEVAKFKKKWLQTAERGAKDRATLRKLTSEELDVSVRLQDYMNDTLLNITNNIETDEFVCEVIGWGEERPNQRTHFPWKVRWSESESAHLEISHGTSATLHLARLSVNDDRERPSYELWFRQPEERDRLHLMKAFNSNGECETYDIFLRLVISAKKASRATQRVLQIRVLADMRDDFKDPREIYRNPIIRARLV